MSKSAASSTNLTVNIGNMPLSTQDAHALGFAVVRQALGVPAAAELDFFEPPEDLANRLNTGERLDLQVGGQHLFSGQIATITHAHDASNGLCVSIRAFDPLHAARRRRRVRAHENASAVTIGRAIAVDLGIGFVSTELPPTRALFLQQGQSDLELLVSMAAESGLYPVVQGGELRLLTLAGDGAELPLRLGRGLRSVTVGVSDETTLRHVETRGWDSSTLAEFKEVAATARQDAYEMHDLRVDLGAGSGERQLLDRIVESALEARGLAQAALDHAAASEAVVQGTCDGQPALIPGRPVRLEGVARRLCGRYVVTSVVHRLNHATGYTTEFATDPPRTAERDRRPVLTQGKVSSVADPFEAGRCRVTLDSFGGLETGWLQVMAPGAGHGKGMLAFPDIGDTVLVVLPDSAAAHGFVLGGLYSERHLPVGAATATARPYVISTAGGQTLTLGRDAALASLATASGSVLELGPDQTRLSAATDLIIEAPGRTIRIRANAIDFEQV